jgi:hypothetical protein
VARKSPKLTASKRRSLRKTQFAAPKGTAPDRRKSQYPVDTPGRAANAKARATQAFKKRRISKSKRDQIHAKANRALARFKRKKGGGRKVATRKQIAAAKRNVKKAQAARRRKTTAPRRRRGGAGVRRTRRATTRRATAGRRRVARKRATPARGARGRFVRR